MEEDTTIIDNIKNMGFKAAESEIPDTWLFQGHSVETLDDGSKLYYAVYILKPGAPDKHPVSSLHYFKSFEADGTPYNGVDE